MLHSCALVLRTLVSVGLGVSGPPFEELRLGTTPGALGSITGVRVYVCSTYFVSNSGQSKQSL